MTRTHQLEATLRTLKLSGMLDTLEARLAQARAGELGHLEFLQVLCEDEIGRRHSNALRQRVGRAKFEEPTTLEDFDVTFNPNIPAATIRDLATCTFIEAGESVILYGPVGVGETFVAQTLGHVACRRDFQVSFAKTSRLLAELGGGHADHTWEQRLRRLARIDLLVLDDFGLREFTHQQGDDFFELVSERHKQGSMVLTSNRTPTHWYGLFPNPVVAEGVLDRLVNCAHHVRMEGRSYRPNKRPGAHQPASTTGGATR